jgi:hypothetical protein
VLFRLPAKIQSARGNSDCPWLLCSGGNPLSPLPRTPLHKGEEQIPASQSQRADNRIDRQTDRYTHKLLPFSPLLLLLNRDLDKLNANVPWDVSNL